MLAQLVDYAFQDLPEARVEAVVRSEVEQLYEENLNILDGFSFDMVAKRIVLRLVLGKRSIFFIFNVSNVTVDRCASGEHWECRNSCCSNLCTVRV